MKNQIIILLLNYFFNQASKIEEEMKIKEEKMLNDELSRKNEFDESLKSRYYEGSPLIQLMREECEFWIAISIASNNVYDKELSNDGYKIFCQEFENCNKEQGVALRKTNNMLVPKNLQILFKVYRSSLLEITQLYLHHLEQVNGYIKFKSLVKFFESDSIALKFTKDVEDQIKQNQNNIYKSKIENESQDKNQNPLHFKFIQQYYGLNGYHTSTRDVFLEKIKNSFQRKDQINRQMDQYETTQPNFLNPYETEAVFNINGQQGLTGNDIVSLVDRNHQGIISKTDLKKTIFDI